MLKYLFTYAVLLTGSCILQGQQPCSGGMAGSFPCGNVNLTSRVAIGSMGGSRGNDVWGWRDPSNGRQYAIMGLNNGTSFVDVTNASSPSIIGRLPTASSNSSWRDIKVVNDHAFIVSEAGGHGMQVFDLTRLRGAGTGNVFSADTTLTDLGGGMTLSNSHNIVADEVNDFVYAVGSNLCTGGLTAIDVSNPKAPIFAGCFSADGYTHDAQIINKAGRQYALACNENSVTIVDV
ncbi:MAG: choice-of-anchor B family protein, partial [Saprospiraceae bacterium]|nr:choice-of-anchor B family protein [Saprospiraceae bacterium]